MKVRVTKRFQDLKTKGSIIREVGDEFIVSKERFDEIRNTLHVYDDDATWIEEVKEEKKSKNQDKE